MFLPASLFVSVPNPHYESDVHLKYRNLFHIRGASKVTVKTARRTTQVKTGEIYWDCACKYHLPARVNVTLQKKLFNTALPGIDSQSQPQHVRSQEGQNLVMQYPHERKRLPSCVS